LALVVLILCAPAAAMAGAGQDRGDMDDPWPIATLRRVLEVLHERFESHAPPEPGPVYDQYGGDGAIEARESDVELEQRLIHEVDRVLAEAAAGALDAAPDPELEPLLEPLRRYADLQQAQGPLMDLLRDRDGAGSGEESGEESGEIDPLLGVPGDDLGPDGPDELAGYVQFLDDLLDEASVEADAVQDAWLEEHIGRPPRFVEPPLAPVDPAEALARLQALRDSGLLGDDPEVQAAVDREVARLKRRLDPPPGTPDGGPPDSKQPPDGAGGRPTPDAPVTQPEPAPADPHPPAPDAPPAQPEPGADGEAGTVERVAPTERGEPGADAQWSGQTAAPGQVARAESGATGVAGTALAKLSVGADDGDRPTWLPPAAEPDIADWVPDVPRRPEDIEGQLGGWTLGEDEKPQLDPWGWPGLDAPGSIEPFVPDWGDPDVEGRSGPLDPFGGLLDGRRNPSDRLRLPMPAPFVPFVPFVPSVPVVQASTAG
jgi:hypothetical protein